MLRGSLDLLISIIDLLFLAWLSTNSFYGNEKKLGGTQLDIIFILISSLIIVVALSTIFASSVDCDGFE